MIQSGISQFSKEKAPPRAMGKKSVTDSSFFVPWKPELQSGFCSPPSRTSKRRRGVLLSVDQREMYERISLRTVRTTLLTLLWELEKLTHKIRYEVCSDIRSLPNPPEGRNTFQTGL
jgi:hypothetical protein